MLLFVKRRMKGKSIRLYRTSNEFVLMSWMIFDGGIFIFQSPNPLCSFPDAQNKTNNNKQKASNISNYWAADTLDARLKFSLL
jgi:hypothetical protein